jgi:spore coat polysaccharide biosynthesis protein SpsF
MGNITLRRANESDLMFYFSLRNDESVRQVSFSNDAIDLETHTSWFSKKLKDPNCYMFVALDDGKPVGQMRIDLEGDGGETNIAIAPEGRGKGYAPIIIREACEAVLKERAEVGYLLAHIRPDNTASIKSFEKAGFVENGVVNYKSTRCLELIFEGYNGEK